MNTIKLHDGHVEDDCQTCRIRENVRQADWAEMTLDDFEELFEDRDPFEFI